MKDLTIKTSSSESVIHCGEGAFFRYAPAFKGRQLFVVSDSNVLSYHRADLWRALGDDYQIYALSPGEKGKSMRNLISILKAMLDSGMKRSCTVVAFGGGVVGDIAGLAASLYMRGVHVVQIPTTLLAQVDSSVGGKTAIDFGNVKNVIGSFYQPEEVIADPRFLKTLPAREIRCGLGEIVKYGALDGDIYDALMSHSSDLSDLGFLGEITYDCIRHKAAVVAEDEHDLTGRRKTLNLGHTTGHAFELYYGRRSHGECVLAGMYYELYAAEKLGVCGGSYAEGLKTLIRAALGKIPAYDDVASAARLARFDKKNEGDYISVVVPRSKGECTEIKLSFAEYARCLTECAAQLKENQNA